MTKREYDQKVSPILVALSDGFPALICKVHIRNQLKLSMYPHHEDNSLAMSILCSNTRRPRADHNLKADALSLSWPPGEVSRFLDFHNARGYPEKMRAGLRLIEGMVMRLGQDSSTQGWVLLGP